MGLIHSLNKYLMHTYYVKDIISRQQSYQMNKTAMISAFTELTPRFKTWPVFTIPNYLKFVRIPSFIKNYYTLHHVSSSKCCFKW